MGWSDYLAAAGCLGTAVTYELHRYKITGYERILTELYEKIKDLELQLEQEGQRANSTLNIEQEENTGSSSHKLNSDNYNLYELKKGLAKLEEANQVLRSDVTTVRQEKLKLEERLKHFQDEVDSLEFNLQEANSEKTALKELYQFRLNNEIEKLITSRDLAIANLHDTVKCLNKEVKGVKDINSRLSEANKRHAFEIDRNLKEMLLLNKQKANDEQSLESLKKKVTELESLNERNKIDLKTKDNELDKKVKEIVELNQKLSNSKEELSKVLSQIEYSQENIAGKEELLSIGNQQIEELRKEIEQQSRLLESKSQFLNESLDTHDEFVTNYKEVEYEIAQLFEEVGKFEKKTIGESKNSNEEIRSEEFEIVKYNESKRPSEDFEELNIEDANKTSSDSSDKEHEQDKYQDDKVFSQIQKDSSEKSESSVDLQDKSELKVAELPTNECFRAILKKIQKVREYIENSRSETNDRLPLGLNKRGLVQKLNTILNEHYEAKTPTPESYQKSMDGTREVEALGVRNDQISEHQLENNLKLLVLQVSEKETQINTLESKLADFSVKVRDIDRLKQVNERLEQAHNDYKKTLTAKESEIDRLNMELAKLLTATSQISNLHAELSAKDKQIHTFESDIQKLLHGDSKSDNAMFEKPPTHNEPIASKPQLPSGDDDIGPSRTEFSTSPNKLHVQLPNELKSHTRKPKQKNLPDSSPNEPNRLPETETDTSILSLHPAKRSATESQSSINKELGNSKYRTEVEKAYQDQIDELNCQLQVANLKITKQYKVISKNLELLKEAKSSSSSPMPSPTKN